MSKIRHAICLLFLLLFAWLTSQVCAGPPRIDDAAHELPTKPGFPKQVFGEVTIQRVVPFTNMGRFSTGNYVSLFRVQNNSDTKQELRLVANFDKIEDHDRDSNDFSDVSMTVTIAPNATRVASFSTPYIGRKSDKFGGNWPVSFSVYLNSVKQKAKISNEFRSTRPMARFLASKGAQQEFPNQPLLAESWDACDAWPVNWRAYTSFDAVLLLDDELERMPIPVFNALRHFMSLGGKVVLIVRKAPVPPLVERYQLLQANAGLGGTLAIASRPADMYNRRSWHRVQKDLFEKWHAPSDAERRAEEMKEVKRLGYSRNGDYEYFVNYDDLACENRGTLRRSYFESKDWWDERSNPSDDYENIPRIFCEFSEPLPNRHLNESGQSLWKRCPVVELANISRGVAIGLLLLFCVGIGPVLQFVLGKKQKRIWMLWLIPAISFSVGGVVFIWSFCSAGISLHAELQTCTVLDQRSKTASSGTLAGYYTPLTRNNALVFDKETLVTPCITDETTVQNYSVQTEEGNQHYNQGWLQAKSQTYFTFRKMQPSEKKLTFIKNKDGSYSVKNELGKGATLTSIRVRMPNGVTLEGYELEIAPSATAKLTIVPDEIAAGRKVRHALVQSERHLNWLIAPVRTEGEGRYFAEVNFDGESGFMPSGITTGMKNVKSEDVILGVF